LLYLCRYGAASKTFSTLLHLLTDSECYFPEKCIIPVPSIINVYTDCIAAHVEATLYDEAVTLCDTVLSKCSLSLPAVNGLAAGTSLQSQCSNDASHWSVEAADNTRKRNRSGSDTDSMQLITNKPIAAQIALYKTEALLQLGRTDDALLCVDRPVSCVNSFSTASSLIV